MRMRFASLPASFARSGVAPLTLFAAVALLTTSCQLGGQSKPARAQEAALELNLNARFGRMELAAERVAPKARDPFFERRKAWGNEIRVADYDVTGLKMKGPSDAETSVKVSWYRANEGDLRVTTLKQKWHDFDGTWQLVDENRGEGDVGLLGEPPTKASEPSGATGARGTPKRAQFPTVYLGSERTATPVTMEEVRGSSSAESSLPRSPTSPTSSKLWSP